MKTVKCRCGAENRIDAEHRSVGDIAKAAGYTPTMNVRSGLDVQYLCPTCWSKVSVAIEILSDVFGDDRTYIHYGSLFKYVTKA
jgi:hypothetical protein